MTDQAPQERLLHTARAWLSGTVSTGHFVLEYWNTRRCLFDIHPEVFVGRFGELVSNLDTALESYSPNPDKKLHEIGEPQLRQEVLEVLRKANLEFCL